MLHIRLDLDFIYPITVLFIYHPRFPFFLNFCPLQIPCFLTARQCDNNSFFLIYPTFGVVFIKSIIQYIYGTIFPLQKSTLHVSYSLILLESFFNPTMNLCHLINGFKPGECVLIACILGLFPALWLCPIYFSYLSFQWIDRLFSCW